MSDTAFEVQAKLYRLLAKLPVTRKAATRAFSRLCARTADGLVRPGRLAGRPVTLDLSRGGDQTIYLQGACDLRGVRAIERVMRRLQPRTAWDIGANRGNHAAFMRPLCQRLACFEPNPAEATRLEELFAGDPDVRILNIGLSDQEARRPFLIVEAESGNSTFEVGAETANATQLVRTGDASAEELGVRDLDFIKLDVEGHEAAVLRGLRRVIAEQRPVIVFEILEAQSTPEFGFPELLPDYEVFGNRTGALSGITMSAYDFCRFEYHRTYMSALAVPKEKRARLAGLLPSGGAGAGGP